MVAVLEAVADPVLETDEEALDDADVVADDDADVVADDVSVDDWVELTHVPHRIGHVSLT